MRIALVSVSDQLGGSEAVLLGLLAELHRTRPAWQPHLIVPGEGPLCDRAAAAGAFVHVVPMPASISRIGEWGARGSTAALLTQVGAAATALPRYQRRFAEAVAAIDPALIHTNGFKAHVFAGRLQTRAARLWHLHEYLSNRPLSRRLLRRYAPDCDVIVANSDSVRRDVASSLSGALRAPVTVIHNGVDLKSFSPRGAIANIDAMCGLPRPSTPTVRVGLVATFARWKGHAVFLRALAALPPEVAVRGYVVGGPCYDTEGSEESVDALRALARELGIEQRVGFTGFHFDVAPIMRSLDIVVHASTQPEPFGLVIAEAMACGRAVLSSGAGGAAEIVSDGVTALLHAPGDAQTLSQQIATLALDPVLRSQLGAAGRGRVEQRFGRERFGREFVLAYESLVSGNKRCA